MEDIRKAIEDLIRRNPDADRAVRRVFGDQIHWPTDAADSRDQGEE